MSSSRTTNIALGLAKRERTGKQKSISLERSVRRTQPLEEIKQHFNREYMRTRRAQRRNILAFDRLLDQHGNLINPTPDREARLTQLQEDEVRLENEIQRYGGFTGAPETFLFDDDYERLGTTHHTQPRHGPVHSGGILQ